MPNPTHRPKSKRVSRGASQKRFPPARRTFEGGQSPKPVNVNLGCGSHIIPGWKNIDEFYAPQEKERLVDFVKGDMRAIPLESDSVDYILCDNALEHVAMHDVPIVIHEIRRVLKKGGRAVIIVPEFRDALNQWAKIDHDHNFNPFFYKYLGEVIYGAQLTDGDYHRTPFCAGFMNYLLQMCGLRDYKLVLHTAFSDSPAYPGVAAAPGSKCRNACLVADIIKRS